MKVIDIMHSLKRDYFNVSNSRKISSPHFRGDYYCSESRTFHEDKPGF